MSLGKTPAPFTREERNQTVWQRLNRALDKAARHQLPRNQLDEITARLHAYVLRERQDATR